MLKLTKEMLMEERREGAEEGRAEAAEESVIYLIESGMPRKFIEGLAKKSGITDTRLAELYKTTQVKNIAS